MSVLIEGLKMPKRMPIQALIFPDGRVFVKLHSGKTIDCFATPVQQQNQSKELYKETMIK